MCRILDVNVGTFYNHLNRRVNQKSYLANDINLKPLVLEVFNKSKQRFGSTKIAQVLKKDGYTISYKKNWAVVKIVDDNIQVMSTSVLSQF